MASVPLGQQLSSPAVGMANLTRSNYRIVLAFALLGYVLLLPPQFNLQFGTMVVPPYRVFLLVGSIFALKAFFTGRAKLQLPDFLMLGVAVWIFIALTNSMDLENAVTGSLSQSVDICLSYFFARACIRTPDDLRMFLILMAPALGIVGLLIAIESIAHTAIIQPVAGALLGQSGNVPYDTRLGLMRALGPFPHPILAGIFLGSFLTIYALSGIRGWPKTVGILASLCSFFSVSSAAILAIVASCGLLAYNWLSERIDILSWRFFVAMAAIATFTAQFATNSGVFGLLVRFGALNSESSYNRVLIWQYGSASVANHPLFGVGYERWERPYWMKASVDNYWLLLALQYGLIPVILLAAAVLIAVFKVGRASSSEPQGERRLYLSMAMSLAIFAFGIISVSIWLSAQIWFFSLLGIAVSLGAKQAPLLAQHPPVASTDPCPPPQTSR